MLHRSSRLPLLVAAILGVDELAKKTNSSSVGARRSNASCSAHVARTPPVSPAFTTSLEETIDSFERLCAGEGDDLPETAFMYVGTLDDARAKAEKMAADA